MTTAAPNYPAHTFMIPENQQQYNLYQEPSPASSASPTSPRMNNFIKRHAPNPYKQIRPLKSPLYIPAALRPTEHFSSPSTPPKSQHGSLDSLQEASRHAELQARAELDFEALHAAWADHEALGSVTGPPTKDHWRPDDASPSCDSPQCRSNFNLFVRKHHCRHCGHIFCSTHVTRMIPLDQLAKFHPEGVYSRACESCYRQYERWDKARGMRRKNSEGSGKESQDGEGEGEEDGPSSLISGAAGSGSGGHKRMISAGGHAMGRGVGVGVGGKSVQELANSVPKDWAWSTF